MSQERDKVRSKSSNYDRIVTPQAWQNLNRRKPVLYSATLHLLQSRFQKRKTLKRLKNNLFHKFPTRFNASFPLLLSGFQKSKTLLLSGFQKKILSSQVDPQKEKTLKSETTSSIKSQFHSTHLHLLPTIYISTPYCYILLSIIIPTDNGYSQELHYYLHNKNMSLIIPNKKTLTHNLNFPQKLNMSTII